MPEGLNFTHMKTLLAIRFGGPVKMSRLSDLMLLEKGSFTPMAARHIEMGLAEKVRSLDDRRVHTIRLTREGRKTADAVGRRFDFPG